MNLIEQQKFGEAERLLRECLEIRRTALPKGHWLIFNTQSVLGESLAGQGADPSLAVGGRKESDRSLTVAARIEKLREAEPLLLDSYAKLNENAEAIPQSARALRPRQALERIVKLYAAWHEAEPDQDYDAKAAEWRAKLPETPAESSGSDSSSGLTSSPTGD